MRIRTMRRKSRNKAGFTLVEIIVVLVILAILAAMIVPSMIEYIDRANQAAMIAEGRNLLLAAQGIITEEYAMDALKGVKFSSTGMCNLCYQTSMTLGNGKTCNQMLREMYELAGVSNGAYGSTSGWFGILDVDTSGRVVMLKYQSAKACNLGDAKANAVAYVDGYINGKRYDGEWVVAVWKGVQLIDLSKFRPTA